MATSLMLYGMNCARVCLILLFGVLPILGCTSETAGGSGSKDATAATDGSDGSDGADSTDNASDGTDGMSGVSLTFDAKGHTITLKWAGDDAPHQRIVITQDKASYTFKGEGGPQATIEPGVWGSTEYTDLVEGEADYKAESAQSSDFKNATVVESGTINLGLHFTHFFDDLAGPSIDVSQLPRRAKKGETLTFTFTTGSASTSAFVFMAMPSEKTDTLQIGGDQTLANNSEHSFDYTFQDDGMYVFELNQSNGIAQAGWGVYVGDTIPIVVGPLDQMATTPRTSPLPLETMRSETLAFVNALRSRADLEPLVAHPLLEQSALAKAEHMSANSYFGHSGAGKKRSDFASEAGYSGYFAELLAVEGDAKRAFYTLWWSPLHRHDMLNPNLRSMGMGAAVSQPSFDEFGRSFVVYHVGDAVP